MKQIEIKNKRENKRGNKRENKRIKTKSKRESTKKYKIIKINKNKKTRSKSRNGGDVIGSGSFGCVFKPALRCENSDTRSSGVSKLLEIEEANDEWTELNNVKSIVKNIPNYENYFLLSNLEKCKPNLLTDSDKNNIKDCTDPLRSVNIENINNELDKLLIINIPFGGHSIKKILSIGETQIYVINYALISLLKKAIIPMNRLGIFHFDIKADNVLYDGNYAKLIDWGISGISRPSQIVPEILLDKTVLFNGPFSRLLFSNYLNNYLDVTLKQYPEINRNSPTLHKQLFLLFWQYYNLLTSKIGKGHEQYLNDVILPEIFNLSGKKIPSGINLTKMLVVSYCAKVLLKYMDFNTRKFKMTEYFTEVYSKNVDVWGLIMVYLPIMLGKNNNNNNNNNNLDRIKINIANILIKYCFSGKYADVPIQIDDLIVDLIDITDDDINNKLKSPINIESIMSPFQYILGKKPDKKTRKAQKPKQSLIAKKLKHGKHSKKAKRICPPGTKRKAYCKSRDKLYKYKRKYGRCPNTTRKVYLCKEKGENKPFRPNKWNLAL